MKLIKSALMFTMFFSTVAVAVGLPISGAPDFSKWAHRTLQDKGITNARIVETKYPFSFTYCRDDSLTLWRYDAMSTEQLDAIRDGKTVKPLTEAQRTVAVENESGLCKTSN